MKKTISLLGICLLFIAGCSKNESISKSELNSKLKSTPDYQWETFIPSYNYQTPSPAGSVRYNSYNAMTFLAYCTSTQCESHGSIVFTMTGGVKYRVSYTSSNSYSGGGGITTPVGNVKPGIPLEWTSGDCTFSGSGASSYGHAGYTALVDLKFERSVEIPPIPAITDSIFVTETREGMVGTVTLPTGQTYPNGQVATSDIYSTKTVNSISYGGTIPRISYKVDSTPYSDYWQAGAHVVLYPWTATYSGIIYNLP
jgi:hypothetical protein